MTTKIINSISVAALMIAASTANATLESRLSGMAYYDTDTNLTWAAPGYILSEDTFFNQIDKLLTYTLGGIGEWSAPNAAEFFSLVIDHSVPILFDGIPIGLLDPIPPLDFESLYSWYWVGSWYGSVFVYRPGTLEGFPGDVSPSLSDFRVWQVHHGDVPLTAIPEPQTYAMLLAGLGLMGFSMKRSAINTSLYA
jgi:hypothetical protein